MLLLPDWYDFLEPVNREAAGLERFCAMRRRYRDRYRRFADIDHANPMRNRDAHDAPAPASLLCQLAHFRQRHRFVGFVFEPDDLAPGVFLARAAHESTHPARRRVGYRRLEHRDVEALARDPDRSDPGSGAGAAAD